MTGNNYPDPLLTGGTDYYPGRINGWFEYPFSDWWNIWFYDHPFSPDRMKEGFIEFDIFPLEPTQPMWVEVAVNWSTAEFGSAI